MTTDPLQAAPLTDEELKEFCDDLRDANDPLIGTEIHLQHGYAGRLIATIDHLKSSAERTWRCFHCDAVFTDTNAASAHFGDSNCEGAGCQLNAMEGGILKLYRDVLAELDTYRREDTFMARQFYALGSEHCTNLREAEQQGYDKGLADGRALLPAPPASVVSAPAPGEVEQLRAIIRDFAVAAIAPMVIPTASAIVWHDFAACCAQAILSHGYRKSLPSAEVEGVDAEKLARSLSDYAVLTAVFNKWNADRNSEPRDLFKAIQSAGFVRYAALHPTPTAPAEKGDGE